MQPHFKVILRDELHLSRPVGEGCVLGGPKTVLADNGNNAMETDDVILISVRHSKV